MRSVHPPVSLILSGDIDPHVDAVVQHAHSFDVEILRLDTKFANRDFCASVAISGDSSRPAISLAGRDRDVRSIWYRRPRPPEPHPAVTDDRFGLLSASEMRAFLQNLYRVAGGKILPPPWAVREADNKLSQLAVARRVGLSIPRTLVTNDPAKFIEFSQGSDVCVKALAAYHWNDEHDVEFALRTARVPATQIEKVAQDARVSPSLLQEYVAKKFEWRITVVDEDVFACRMNTQSVSGAEEDWRVVDFDLIEHEISELPLGLTDNLRAYLNHFGLNFGAFDFIETPNGEMVFLECNPNGQWLWIEMKTGAPISLAIAKYLFS